MSATKRLLEQLEEQEDLLDNGDYEMDLEDEFNANPLGD